MSKQCLKCNYVRQATDQESEYLCPKCGAIYAKVEAHNAAQIIADKKEQDVMAAARASKDWSKVDPKILRRELASVVFSTTDNIPGFAIVENVDIVSADSAYAFGAIGEIIGGFVRNVVGDGKSNQTIAFLSLGRNEVLNALRLEAINIGAHAVVGLRIDYEEFSGANGHGVIIITGIGTAVRMQSV